MPRRIPAPGARTDAARSCVASVYTGSDHPEDGVPDGQATEQIIADRYVVERRIAKGGMSTVYLARQVKVNRRVALKVVAPPPDEEMASDFLRRFQLEAETLAALDHPNIVTLYDFGELPSGQFYLAMEYVEGPRFTDLVKEGPLPVDEAIRLLLQVCDALRYAHGQGVVHRDLKPGNLLVRATAEGIDQVKVVDFGLVKHTEDDQSITQAGMILGSPHCMAPEQIHGRTLDHRADIYAVGILLFRIVVGSYPFHGESSGATMVAHLQEPIPSMGERNPELALPDGFEAVVRRCLAKSPSDRYPDMDALITELSLLQAALRGEAVADAAAYMAGLTAAEKETLRLVPDRDLPAAKLVRLANTLRGLGAGRVMLVSERALE